MGLAADHRFSRKWANFNVQLYTDALLLPMQIWRSRMSRDLDGPRAGLDGHGSSFQAESLSEVLKQIVKHALSDLFADNFSLHHTRSKVPGGAETRTRLSLMKGQGVNHG